MMEVRVYVLSSWLPSHGDRRYNLDRVKSLLFSSLKLSRCDRVVVSLPGLMQSLVHTVVKGGCSCHVRAGELLSATRSTSRMAASTQKLSIYTLECT